MRKAIMIALLLAVTTGGVWARQRGKTSLLKVMSFNIRFDTPNDTGSTSWEARREPCRRMMNDLCPDVIGIQEARGAMTPLIIKMMSDYEAFHIPVEHSLTWKHTGDLLILYRKGSFTKVADGYFWLSETPEEPSVSWNTTDTHHFRAAIWVRLRRRTDGKEFFFVTTHFPYKQAPVDTEVRARCAQLILDRLSREGADGKPVFITGDMNAEMGGENEASLAPFIRKMKSARLTAKHTDDHASLNKYKPFDSQWKGQRIDHIYYKNAYALKFETVDKPLWGVTYISDHYPITCTFEMEDAAYHYGKEWLGNAVFYDIFPSSFMDSDGDGIGDLRGIISKLDYVKSLGADAVWMNPIYLSGWFDGGYDVIDPYQVDSRFGTNGDVVRLVREAHLRGLKVCLDLVPGHTSSRSPWFLQSASGMDLRYSDYYIWTDSISEKERQLIVERKKNNPERNTKGKYVQADMPRGKYYMKNFYECQPALNYGFANPDPRQPWQQPVSAPGPRAVRQELKNIMAFWLDKGIDGFRVDMAKSLVKGDDEQRSGTIALWQDVRQWLDENYPGRVLISEWGCPQQSILAGFDIDFYLQHRIKPFHDLIFEGFKKTLPGAYFEKSGQGHIADFVKVFDDDFQATRDKGYISITTSSHDYPRPNNYTRSTLDELKVFMTFVLTMPGVPFIHYGDELGMRYDETLPSKEGSKERSGTRTPMQWDDTPTAGFSTCDVKDLYLPVNTFGGKITVEAEDRDSNSMLNFTRQLIALRHGSQALTGNADWQMVSDPQKPYPMVYQRTDGKDTFVIALNPKGRSVDVNLGTLRNFKGRPVMSVGKSSLRNGHLKMAATSAVIFK